jgi:hypothetical protein
MMDSAKSYLMPADFDYLRRGGRLSPLVSYVGKAIKLVPVLTQTEDGKQLTISGVRRSFKQAIQSVASSLAERGVDESWNIYITHAAVPETKDLGLPKPCSGVAITASPVTDRNLTRMVVSLCRSGNIPYAMEVSTGSTGTNANVLGISAYGIPTALCSLPLKSMHTSAEVLNMEDANALKRVVAAFIRSKEIAEVYGV